jgi:hypothetical protein
VTLDGGLGFIAVSLYRQKSRQILHLNNRIITARVPGRQDRLLPLGPVRVRLPRPADRSPPRTVSLRVAGTTA